MEYICVGCGCGCGPLRVPGSASGALRGLLALLSLLCGSAVGVDHVGERTFEAECDEVYDVDIDTDEEASGAFQPRLR